MLKFNNLVCLALFASVFLISVTESNAQSGGSVSTNCPGFRTQTQGGWGSSPSGNNPGMFLQMNFAAAFPNGIEIGCTNSYKFTSATAVKNFLPSGGTPRLLPAGTTLNPTGSFHSNTFAGQMLALAVSLGFDNAIASFGSSNLKLKDLIIRSGTFQGWTVQQLFDAANNRIGGCSNSNLSISTFNQGVTSVNESYVDGSASGNYLECPAVCTLAASLGQTAVKNVACWNETNGSVTITVSGGTAPITYLWSNGAVTKDLTNVGHGTYSVIIKDSKGCTATLSATVTQPTVLTVVPTSTNVSCKNGTNGSISLTNSGGTGTLTTTWTDGFVGGSRSNLVAGQYCYNVKDENNCEKSACVTIAEPKAIAVILSVPKLISCNNICDGSVLATVSGGTGNLSITWSNGNTNNPLTGLCSGDYSAKITDANGCIVQSELINLANPDPLVITPSKTPTSSCICTGTSTATVSGGTKPYSYTWSNGTSGVNTVANLCLGINTSVNVTDANACPASFDFGQTKYQGGCNGTEIIDYFQAKRADGSNVDAIRSDPNLAKGVPENTNLPGSFFSLGFGGYVVVKIGGGIYNRLGKDLRVVETTYWGWGCTRYEERARVFISSDGITWIDKGQICQDGEIDITPLNCVTHVKIVDESIASNFINEPVIADGFDVDGIECIGATSNARIATQELDENIPSDEAKTRFISKSVNIYPNPAEDQLSMELNGTTEGEVIMLSIYDNVGKNVKSVEMNAGQSNYKLNIPVADLKSGIYHVIVRGTDLMYSQKVVKK